MRADYQLVPWKEDVKKALKAWGGDVLCLWHPGWTFPPYILDNRLVWQVLFEINFKLIPVVTLHIWSSSRLCFLNCQSSLHMFNPRNLKHIQTLRGARRAAGQKWISGWKLRDLGRYRPCLLDRRSEHHCNALQRLVLWLKSSSWLKYSLRFARWKKASRGSLIRTLGSPFLRRASGT